MRVLFVGGPKDGQREEVPASVLSYTETGTTYVVQRLAPPCAKGQLGGRAYPVEWPLRTAVERLLESYLVFPALYARLLELRAHLHGPKELMDELDGLVRLAEGVR